MYSLKKPYNSTQGKEYKCSIGLCTSLQHTWRRPSAPKASTAVIVLAGRESWPQFIDSSVCREEGCGRLPKNGQSPVIVHPFWVDPAGHPASPLQSIRLSMQTARHRLYRMLLQPVRAWAMLYTAGCRKALSRLTSMIEWSTNTCSMMDVVCRPAGGSGMGPPSVEPLVWPPERMRSTNTPACAPIIALVR